VNSTSLAPGTLQWTITINASGNNPTQAIFSQLDGNERPTILQVFATQGMQGWWFSTLDLETTGQL